MIAFIPPRLSTRPLTTSGSCGGVSAGNAASGVSDAVDVGAGDAVSIKRLWLVLTLKSLQQKS